MPKRNVDPRRDLYHYRVTMTDGKIWFLDVPRPQNRGNLTIVAREFAEGELRRSGRDPAEIAAVDKVTFDERLRHTRIDK